VTSAVTYVRIYVRLPVKAGRMSHHTYLIIRSSFS